MCGLSYLPFGIFGLACRWLDMRLVEKDSSGDWVAVGVGSRAPWMVWCLSFL